LPVVVAVIHEQSCHSFPSLFPPGKYAQKILSARTIVVVVDEVEVVDRGFGVRSMVGIGNLGTVGRGSGLVVVVEGIVEVEEELHRSLNSGPAQKSMISVSGTVVVELVATEPV
jgi:hypothetical protein